jgi:hypothetical protein
MGAEQKVLIAKQMRDEAARAKRRADMIQRYYIEGVVVVALILMIGWSIALMSWVVQDRIKKYPQYGTDWIPKSEAHRMADEKPKVYTGR